MAANDAVSMNVAENRQNVPMAIQENRAAVPMTVAEGGGTPGGLNRKADKVTGAVAGNLAGLDANGNLTDSGKAPGDFLEAPATAGSEGQVLTADGEGGASWQDPTGGDPTEIIDDNAGSGDTDKVWSADKSHSLLTEINSKADKTVTDALQKNKAPVIIDSATGNPIVLTDGADGLPVEGMKIHFLPKQNLNGQDAPYPPGGGVNLFDKDNVTTGSRLSTTGVPYIDSNYYISAKIPVQYGKTYVKNSPTADAYHRACIYSSSDVFLAKVDDSNTIEITNSNSAYIMFCGERTELDTAMFVEGDTAPSTYAPYSNICPIIGWSGLAVRRTRKNLLDLTVYNGGSYNPKVGTVFKLSKASDEKQFTDNGDGTFSVTTSSTWNAHTLLVPITPGLPYHTKFGFSSSGTGGVTRGYLDKDFTVLESSSSQSATQNVNVNNNIPDGASYYFILISNRSTAKTTLTLTKPQTEIGTSATPYEKYVGESYHVTFPVGETIYGGTFDAVTGVLTVDMASVDMGTLTWTEGTDATGKYFKTNISGIKGVSGSAVVGNLICSAYKTVASNAVADLCIAVGTVGDGSVVYCRNLAYSNAQDFTSAVNGQTVVYELATPIEIPLSAISVTTLLGDNTIWSDANGTIELDYRADTKLFIAKNKQDIRATIAPIEDGTTASKAYSAGKFFYHDGQFCKAKTSIAAGATFTLNTNYQITTVADELFALN